MKTPNAKSLLMVGAGLLVPMLAARLSRMAVGGGYRLLTHGEPPKNPANPEVGWKDALVWAAVSGLVGGMARLAARRLLSETMIPAEDDDMEDEVDAIV